MPLDSYYSVFLVGTLGGTLIEFLHWYNIRRRGDFPLYARRVKYWVLTAIMAVAGGMLAVFYFGNHAEAILALHVGISAPLIFQKLVTTAAEPGERTGEAVSVTSFFTW